MIENDNVGLRERIARVVRYAQSIKGITGLKGYGDDFGDPEYAKAHQKPSVWWNGIEYKWDPKRLKYLHWVNENGAKKAYEPPDEALNPLFGDFSKPIPASKQDDDKPLAPMTEYSPGPNGKKPEQPSNKPKQHLLFGDSETTTEKNPAPKKSEPKSQKAKEPEKTSTRPLSLFDGPVYANGKDDRDDPHSLFFYDGKKPETKTEERLQKIVEKAEEKKTSEPKANGGTLKERLRQIAEINAVVEKPLAPMTTSGHASSETRNVQYAQNAEDFAAIAQKVRGEIMSSRAAKKDDAETQKDVDDFHEVVPLFADIKKKVRETGKFDPEDDKIWDEKIQPFLNNCAQSFAKTLTRPERERNLAFLKAAFPDRGGSTFFSDDYIEETIELFKKKKIKVKADDLRYVFDAYNVLGKSFNAKGKWYSPPRFSFNFNENKKHGGSFDARFNKIDINPNPESTMGPQTALIHELGHWLEDNILGIDVKGETREWLAKETGDGENFPGINDYAVYQIPHEKAPVLGYRFDGYSMIAYPLQAFYDDRGEFRRDKGGTEIFSTGMEGLVRRPDYFARCNPKHFNRMIECLSKLLKDK